MGVIQLCQAFQNLDQRRAELDKRRMKQAYEGITCEDLSGEVEATLSQLSSIIDRLARLPARRQAELRGKAGVVAALMRGTMPYVPAKMRANLVQSLLRDIAAFERPERMRCLEQSGPLPVKETWTPARRGPQLGITNDDADCAARDIIVHGKNLRDLADRAIHRFHQVSAESAAARSRRRKLLIDAAESMGLPYGDWLPNRDRMR